MAQMEPEMTLAHRPFLSLVLIASSFLPGCAERIDTVHGAPAAGSVCRYAGTQPPLSIACLPANARRTAPSHSVLPCEILPLANRRPVYHHLRWWRQGPGSLV